MSGHDKQDKNYRIDSRQLETLISTAMKKIGAKKDNALCHFLPGTTGGYMHHFTLRKMKTAAPEQLAELLNKYVIKVEKPSKVGHKPRAPRGSRKRKDQFQFSKQDIERMLNMARLAGDKEIIRKLTPKKDLRTIKRELISSIKHSTIDVESWNAYIEAINSQNAATSFTSAVLAGVSA